MDTRFIDDRGLVNSRIDEKHAENSPLWTFQLILMNMLLGESFKVLQMSLNEFYRSCKIRDGLYNQRPKNSGSHEDYMSHDQLTAMFCFFYLFGHHDECQSILGEIKRQKGHYDNINPDNPDRPLHPRDIIFIRLLMNDYRFFRFFYRLLFKVIIFETCNKKWKVRPAIQDRIKYFFKHFKFIPKEQVRKMPSTDGKILTFVRCNTVLLFNNKDSNNDFFKSLWEGAVDRVRENKVFYGYTNVFTSYFKKTNQPIRVKTFQLHDRGF